MGLGSRTAPAAAAALAATFPKVLPLRQGAAGVGEEGGAAEGGGGVQRRLRRRGLQGHREEMGVCPHPSG